MSEPVDYRLGRIPDLRFPKGGNFALDFTFTGIDLTGCGATLTARRAENKGSRPLTWSKSGLTVASTTISFDFAQTQVDDASKALSLVAAEGSTDYALTVRLSGGSGAIVFRLQGTVEWVDDAGDFDPGTASGASFTFAVSGATVSVDVTSSGRSRSHAMTSTSDHTSGNWKVFHSNGSGQVVELALGDSGKVLTSNGATSAPTFETPAGGSVTLDTNTVTSGLSGILKAASNTLEVATAETDYASPAQGALAATAVQPNTTPTLAGLNVDGTVNIGVWMISTYARAAIVKGDQVVLGNANHVYLEPVGDDVFAIKGAGGGATFSRACIGGTSSAFPAFKRDGANLMFRLADDSGDCSISAAKITASAPVVVASYTVVTVPAASSHTRGLIYVSDESGGATLAFSDGTDWRRLADRAVIS